MGLTIQFKRLNPNARIPNRAHPTDLGFDLFTVDTVPIPAGSVVAVSTAIAARFPEGWGGIIKARSSQGKVGINILGGVVDQGYRGEIIVLVHNTNDPQSEGHEIYHAGDKIAQLVILPVAIARLVEADELSETRRGHGRFGSTGRSK